MALAPPSKERDRSEETSKLWRYSGMGTELAAAIIGMTLLGYLIDRWAGSLPWCTMGGAFVGIMGGGYNFLKKATSITREAAADFRREHPQGLPPDKVPIEGSGADPWEKRWAEKWGDRQPGEGPGAGPAGGDADGDD